MNSYNGRVCDRDHAEIVTFVMHSVDQSPTRALAGDFSTAAGVYTNYPVVGEMIP